MVIGSSYTAALMLFVLLFVLLAGRRCGYRQLLHSRADAICIAVCAVDRSTVWLSTAPTQPLTHWYQVRCLLQDPVFVKTSETLVGCVHLRSNTRYDKQ